MALGALALVLAAGSEVDTVFLRVTPTDHVLALAERLAELGKVERLEAIADSAPASPLGRMMKVGLVASRARPSLSELDEQMKAAGEVGAGWRRAVFGVAGLLGLGCWASLVVLARARSGVGIALTVSATLLAGLAASSAVGVERDLARARAVLAPLLLAAQASASTQR